MTVEYRVREYLGRALVLVLLSLTLMPLPARDPVVSSEKRTAAHTSSGGAVDFWLQSRADLDLVSAATAILDTPGAPLFVLPAIEPHVAFLSARAIPLLDEADRTELRRLAEQGVPIICECGEYVLGQLAGFTPVEQESQSGIEYFVYRKTSDGVLRSSVLYPGPGQGIAPEPLQPGAPDPLRTSLLREALLQSLANTAPAGGTPDPAAPVTAGAGDWWTNLSDARKTWTWYTPEVCAATTQCWDYKKNANKFTVKADFYKIPDGKVDTDYYMVEVTSEHVPNYTGSYLSSSSTCSDGWVGWYVSERRLKMERQARTSKLEDYVPTSTMSQQQSSWTLGASISVGYKTAEGGISASHTVTNTVSDAEVIDFSKRATECSDPEHCCSWKENFVKPKYGTVAWNFSHPGNAARGTFYSKRAAIYSTSSPSGGIDLAITPWIRFEKDRVDWRPYCAWWDIRPHPYVIDTTGPALTPDSSQPVPWARLNVKKNYAPDAPPRPNLTIPSGSTALWTNVPLTVNVPAAHDRDGDRLDYSIDFGDGAVGPFAGSATQSHTWNRPGKVMVKAKVRDMHGSPSEWSESAEYTIRGLGRVQITGLAETPELGSVQLVCVATMSDDFSLEVTSHSPSGWEGGVIRWYVDSPYATISSTGLLRALSAQGADRVVTVQATYTLKGIERTTTHSMVIKNTGAGLAPAISSVVNGASFLPGISGAAWTTIYGFNLAGASRHWRGEEIVGGKLPTVLDGVSVTFNGQAAAICYISPGQLNVQAPSSVADGQVTVQVTTPHGTATATAQMNRFAPALFTFAGKYVAAQHTDYSYVAAPGLLSGVTASPARPGEMVILYAAGFGPTAPETPCGMVITAPAPLANPVTVRIGDRAAEVRWMGISGAGLWQLNVVIPGDVPDGDRAVVAEVGGVRTQPDVFITVVRRVGGAAVENE